MRVIFEPLAHFAPSKSVTAREWETLARMAGELQADGVECQHAGHRFERSMPGEEIEGLISIVSAQVANAIRATMRGAGMRAEEWTFFVSPHPVYLWPMPETRLVSEVLWRVESHLIPIQSAAKAAVTTNDAPVAPTLAEQHGAAKR